MNIKLYPSKNNYSVSLGRKGEYNVTYITFDLSAYAQCYGNGYAELIVTNPNHSVCYPVELEESENNEEVAE